ncbi:pyridoxal 5'-phosphate synthase glutaminase subunit PdxT [Microbacterium amylolyticum]|uniref:Pyridoxal 5'-phosphate synthase subunit PdxT n=1 Tax=Microbacterium amylolyticum TaxID=936337 RepID=A0ABS4ZE01_9MICO|nr:pyridoxal 5'-phosphate synthase glutaminase subunit PdxT [Microbacterium amylolyticum]MBP2435509.1 5'-phosphate synthase pdxT subunit [Microbacterium amylolyticum]
MVRVGVLALQGDVREHAALLAHLGAHVSHVRRPEELREVDGLVLPGGESSVIDKLARIFDLREPLVARIREGLPVYGTCAGLILLADRLADGIDGQRTFGGLNATVRRNAFGRQNDSFETEIDVPALGDPPVRATFIRAPVIDDVGPSARALATLPDGRIVAAEQGNLLGTAFHPEVTGETRFHERFLARVRAAL